ncbi:MAG: hypothetical protein ACXAD7_10775 [Candidatus Kariarchaeaceae archaeon]|jgi:exosome complex component RRP41
MENEYRRPDGRLVDEIRDLKIEVGILDRADGSAKVHLGRNMAIASVYGPRELHPKHAALANKAVVRLNYRMATFSVDDYKKPFPSRREKEISKVLSEAFESVVLTKQWPRSVIDVHIQLFQSDGGTRTAAAIAASAALADAGIPMKELSGGIAAGIYEDRVVIDMTGHEDMKGTGDMPVLYSPKNDEVSLFQLDGMFTFEQFNEAFTKTLKAIEQVVDSIQMALKQKYITIRDEIDISDDGISEVVEEEEKLAEKLVKEIDEEERKVTEEIADMQVISPVEEIDPVVPVPTEITSPEELKDDVVPVETEEILPGVTDPSEVKTSQMELSTDLEDEKFSFTSEKAAETIDKQSWFDKATSLKPMETSLQTDESIITKKEESDDEQKENNGSEENDVLRDLEYSEFEEED